MKKLLKIFVALIVLIAVIIAGVMISLTQGLGEGKNIEINGINMSNIEDGTYKGSYEFRRWSNELEVVVIENKITAIKILSDVKYANPAVSDKLFDEVIEAQDTRVDAVSGATVTSKAYLRSIENALIK
jgi:uncharacterized protein with FMN-binding domain